MQWSQVLIIVGSIIGSTYIFFMIVREDVKFFKEQMVRMDAKWDRLFEKHSFNEKSK